METQNAWLLEATLSCLSADNKAEGRGKFMAIIRKTEAKSGPSECVEGAAPRVEILKEQPKEASAPFPEGFQEKFGPSTKIGGVQAFAQQVSTVRRTLNSAENRLAELKAALENNLSAVDDTYKSFLLGELQDIEDSLNEADRAVFVASLSRADFRFNLVNAHKRFLEADISFALDVAKDFLTHGDAPQAEFQFERARAIVENHKLSPDELEKKILEVKQSLRPNYQTELEKIQSALSSTPPRLADAQAAMSAAKKLGALMGKSTEHITSDIQIYRNRAAKAVQDVLYPQQNLRTEN